MGAGSALSGLLGGLPMISEIVRSSANIGNGGKTQWANFFHGGFLLLFLLLGKPIIEQIPLAALAAMLIHVGFRLASPTEFKHVYKIGKEQLLIFLTTLITVLATDLILGVLAGILMQVLIHLYYGAPLKFLFKSRFDYARNQDQDVIYLQHSAIFSNYISLKSEIERRRNQGRLKLDFTHVNLIDHTFRTHLNGLIKEWDKEGKQLILSNAEHLIPVSDHPLATQVKKEAFPVMEEKLTEHQQHLKKIASKNEWKFLPAKTISFDNFVGFNFGINSKIVHAQNIVSGKYEGVRLIYSEIIYDKTPDTASADSQLSALLIIPTVEVPVFMLEREGFFEKITDLAYRTDIDFDAHPVFSDKFVLKGPDESAIRNFFHPGIIRKVEEHPHFHMESNGEAILLYRFDKSDSDESISELIRFGKVLSLMV